MNVGDSMQQSLQKLDHPKLKCVEEIAKQHFRNKNTKFNSDGLNTFVDVIKVFIYEAAARAAIEAKKDGAEGSEIEVKNEHLEKILPQLLLQF